MKWFAGNRQVPWYKKLFSSPLFRGKQKKVSKKGTIIAVSVAVAATGLLIVSFFLFNDLPSPRKLSSGDFPVSTQLFDRNGELLYEIYANEHRTPVALAALPGHVSQATIAIEDKDFYHHFGFSLQGMIRAVKNIVFENKLQGGSTITQQLVKTALLTPERTLVRKVREGVLTIGTEIIYSKEDILEMYLNHVPYGGTAYGIEAAAQKFFGKSAQQLTLAEAALLAGLPQAPSRYSPFINPEQAKARQAEVLRRMVEDQYIAQEEADAAMDEVLSYVTASTNIRAPHFVFYVKNLLEEKYGLQTVERGGLRVTTTLDLELQNYAQASVSAELENMDRYKISNGAVLVAKPNTGEILAMVGSKNYFDTANDGQVNLTNRLRQPGSSIKPINYVAALQMKKLTPASILLDIPTCFQVTGQKPYCPKNYDGGFRGPVTFRSALANSYNIPAVKILAINSLETMIATASAMGITSFTDPSRYGLSLTLGGGEVTMMDMATAFGTLANQGVKVPLNPILEVKDYTGKVLETYDPAVVATELAGFFDETDERSNVVGETRLRLYRALNREPAFMVADIMADNAARSAAFGANSKLRIANKTVSVKTGTTNDIRDNWTIGFTPEFLVAVWVGNNDNTPMNPYLVSGVTGAAPIWNDVMSYVLKDREDVTQPIPSGIARISVCTQTGAAPVSGAECTGRAEYFWKEKLPSYAQVERKNIWVYKDTGQVAFFHSGEVPDELVNPDSIELREHTVVSDEFIKDYCIDCPAPPNPEEERSMRPLSTVNMSSFYGGEGFEPLPY
jgi:1A family penicillin-binding protein